ncbi:DAO-domain-containing protein [Fomitiporia mediterranea MF3/22]|uniref:DAO-domain-containing protein n=1 Tax=Fomitiporia mediterranea (strain MF3/22) TaxID=694068 RepID=UPI000440865F|nr:DAO-domain-containing protein [Fomitiporia mediterranea MF3/22]EJC99722.1 DAO-domain-containing protein [Fomitiporia mediterranea MF3/22]
MPYRPDLPVPLNEHAEHQIFFEAAHHLRDSPASLPVPNSTHSFWLHPSKEVNPLAKEGSEGPITSDADICIIGSGITGVSAAYHLSKSAPEKKVVILEARDFCSGATGRNGGHLTPATFLDFARLAKEMGVEEAKKQFALEDHSADSLVEIIKANRLEDIVDLVSGGHIQLCFTDEELEGVRVDYERAKESGLDVSTVTFLTKEEVHEKFGASYPATRSPAHNVWPLKVVTQLFHLAKAGFSSSSGSLSLFTSAPVTSISPSNSKNNSERRWTLSTPRGSISCTTVLHATNGYASHLLPFLAGPKGIVPTRGQLIATRATVPISDEERASWGGNSHYEYWFPRPPKSNHDKAHPLIILGGGREAIGGYEIGTTDDSTVNPKVGKILREFLPAVFPGKYEKGNEPEREWTGIMGFTSLRDPFVGPVFTPDGSELKGQYISAGYTGHGMPRTFACAEAVTALILHDLSDTPRDNWTVPEWLPKRYLTWTRKLA